MPKLWNNTIAAHRREVRDAILDTAAALAIEHGPLSVTMSQIAEKTGIGRATLYKYFPDVEAILFAWHERRLAEHLEYLTKISNQPGRPAERLVQVLRAYALIVHEAHGRHAELAAFLHRGRHAAHAQLGLRQVVRDLIAEAATTGELRADAPPDELAGYCIHALAAACDLPSRAAVPRLVSMVAAGLQTNAPRKNAGRCPRRS